MLDSVAQQYCLSITANASILLYMFNQEAWLGCLAESTCYNTACEFNDKSLFSKKKLESPNNNSPTGTLFINCKVH